MFCLLFARKASERCSTDFERLDDMIRGPTFIYPHPPIPRGPKSWKNSRSPSGIENFQARLKWMTFSSEIENFKRATHQTPIFVGNSRGQDWKFQARLKFSSEIENFKRKLEVFKRSSEIGFFQDSGPLGPWIYPSRRWVGCLQEGGGIQTLCCRGLKIYTPPPSPENYLMARNVGEVYNFSL